MYLAQPAQPSDYVPAVWDVRNNKFNEQPMQQGFGSVLEGYVDSFKKIHRILKP